MAQTCPLRPSGWVGAESVGGVVSQFSNTHRRVRHFGVADRVCLDLGLADGVRRKLLKPNG